jgi:hypothetical protein
LARSLRSGPSTYGQSARRCRWLPVSEI